MSRFSVDDVGRRWDGWDHGMIRGTSRATVGVMVGGFQSPSLGGMMMGMAVRMDMARHFAPARGSRSLGHETLTLRSYFTHSKKTMH